MKVGHSARAVKARELNDSLVGESFSYESSAGVELHGRIALIEVTRAGTKVTLDGVISGGESRVLSLGSEEELWFDPQT